MYIVIAAFISGNLLCNIASVKAAALQRHMSTAPLLQG